MAIVYVAAIWLIVIGVIRIILANKLHKIRKTLDAEILGKRWWLMMAMGVLLIVCGISSLLDPSGLIVAIGIHFGLNIIVAGANMIAVAA